jgi:hypothetical protein
MASKEGGGEEWQERLGISGIEIDESLLFDLHNEDEEGDDSAAAGDRTAKKDGVGKG